MLRIPRRVATVVAFSLLIVPLASCGNDDDSSSDTTVAVETSVAADTTVALDSTAVETIPAVETTVAVDTTVAADETADSVADATTDTATPDESIADTAVAASSDEVLDGFLAGAGITDAAQVKCVRDGAGDVSKLAEAATPPAALFRSLIDCAPDVLAKSAGDDLIEKDATITADQATCAGKAQIAYLKALSDDEIATLFANTDEPAPDELKAIIKKDCGLSDEQIEKNLNG